MLSVHHVSKSFGLEPVLKDINFSLNPGERWGLVGINGTGKSTLLRILVGDEQADSGSFVFTPSNLRVGYLAQGFVFEPEATIANFIDTQSGNLDFLTNELSTLAERMMQENENEKLQRRYDQILAELELAGQSETRAPAILEALGLGNIIPETQVSHLSGGQKTRLMLAGILLSNPQLLLLDEPTNHLDIDMLRWLEDWLNQFHGAVLIVSHDRTFLDHCVNGILELNEHSHEVKAYIGNYNQFLEQKINEREKQWQAFKDQQDEIIRLQHAASDMRSKAKYRKGGKTDPENTDGFSIGFFANRTKEVIQKAKNIERRVEKMLTEEKIDKPARTWQMRVDFSDLTTSGRDVLVMDSLSVGYGDLVLLNDLNMVLRYGERVALIGPNGCGKTTLVKTITGEIPALGGSFRLGSNVQFGYMTQEQKELETGLNAVETLRKIAAMNETELRSFLSKFLFTGDDVFNLVENMSYGERARLSLACLVASGCNFLILDEPINHLDIPSRTRFEQALTQFDGTVLAIVHDRYFIEGYATQIWEVKGDRIYNYQK
ncbi:MAG: hypothetical protein CVU39_09185 [Chloroflexi bacterium HGW-Chloroflexi-10]|nr:MAG: hypothetical protein CVU39_09185 [Chloroflexi bacterium HGW-Chloroflexi-10]